MFMGPGMDRNFSYVIIDEANRKLVGMGYVDRKSILEDMIKSLSLTDIKYQGPGCYGEVIQSGIFTVYYWRGAQNGYKDILVLMEAAEIALNGCNMIYSHNEMEAK